MMGEMGVQLTLLIKGKVYDVSDSFLWGMAVIKLFIVLVWI